MLKRIVAGLLWFFVTWYAWSVLAFITGAPDVVGPVLGVVVGALLAGDPMGRIWNQPTVIRDTVVTAPRGTEPA